MEADFVDLSAAQSRPTDREVLFTSLTLANYEGWYCLNHPPGEELANDHDVGRAQFEKDQRAIMGPEHFDAMVAAGRPRSSACCCKTWPCPCACHARAR